MRTRMLLAVSLLLTVVLAPGCWEQEPPTSKARENYVARVREAQELTDEAEQLYHEATQLDLGSERTALLKKAYSLADRAMVILNKLDDKYGNYDVPEEQVPTYVPVLRKCTKVIGDIQKIMPVKD